MTWVAVAVGGASLVGGIMSSNAAKSAAQTQSDASLAAAQLQQQTANGQIDYLKGQQADTQGAINNQSTNVNTNYSANANAQNNLYGGAFGSILNGYNTANNNLQPYLNAGNAGASTLQSMIPQLSQTFGPDQFYANLDPNYSFMSKQGIGAVKQGLNVNGGGSNITTGATKFAEDYANNAYQNAFNNWNTQNNSIYNRLAGIAGLGSVANQTGAGVATGMGSNIGSITNAGGSTLASLGLGYTGLGNQLTGYGTNYNLGQSGNITNLATGGAAAGAAGLTGSAMANASGTVGSSNALTNGFTGAANGVVLSSLLKPAASPTQPFYGNTIAPLGTNGSGNYDYFG